MSTVDLVIEGPQGPPGDLPPLSDLPTATVVPGAALIYLEIAGVRHAMTLDALKTWLGGTSPAVGSLDLSDPASSGVAAVI